MSKIETGRFSDVLRRLLNMGGQVHVASELAPEISPVFVLELDRPEWAFLKTERLCSGMIGQTAGGAGFRSQAQLLNPAGSGILIIVKRIMLNVVAVDASGVVRRHDTALVTAGSGSRMVDTRYGDVIPAGQVRGSVGAAAVGTAIGQAIVTAASAARTYSRWDDPIILAPGTGVLIDPGTDNTTQVASYYWLERPLGKYET